MKLPTYFDDLFFLACMILFLMINYDLPLNSIYSSMIYLTLFGYLVPLIFNLFEWTPLYNRGKAINELIVGVVSGIGFILFYNFLHSSTQMAAVFASTAFGHSETFGKTVFGALIPINETVFFFIIIPGWILYKIGKSLFTTQVSTDVIVVGVVSAAIFTIFHATSKGLTNNLDLIATFSFAVLSLVLIFYFKSVLAALIAHVVVNSYSVGIVDVLKQWAMGSPIIIGAIVLGAYFLLRNKVRIPYLS